MPQYPTAVLRIGRQELQIFSRTHSPCENCGNELKDHDWADMDMQGFVVGACSFAKKSR